MAINNILLPCRMNIKCRNHFKQNIIQVTLCLYSWDKNKIIDLRLNITLLKPIKFPSSYRPVALENTLAKVPEKHVANIISEAVEEHRLLPWNQMGGRHR